METKIISHEGLLFVTPVHACLQKELQFWHSKTKLEPYSFMKDGQLIEGVKRAGMEHSKELLYSLSSDGRSLITHLGLRDRVFHALKEEGIPFSYEHRGISRPKCTISPAIFKGLRPEQREGVIKMLANQGDCCVEFTMATGKTNMIAALIRAFPDQKIIVTSYRETVVRRLLDGLTELLEDTGERIGFYQGSNRDLQRITCSTLALLDEFDPDEIGIVIVDEAHRGAGDQTSQDLLAFKRALKFGFSGTLKKRGDGKQKFLEGILGPIVCQFTDEEAELAGRVTPQRVYVLSVPEGPSLSAQVSDIRRERLGITRNPCRNRLIAETVQKAPADWQGIIFVRTIEHIDWLLENDLKDMGFEKYHAKISTKEKRRIEAGLYSGELKRLIANDALSEGVDTTQLRWLIDANWSSSDVLVSQKGGRNRRLLPGKDYGIIVNFADDWIELALAEQDKELALGAGLPAGESNKKDGFFMKANNRIRQYSDRGWPILRISKPEDIVWIEGSSDTSR